ncbi:MAG: hypothetical protein KKB13_20475 [Chloroflexi bacterium]|nr:hypothetical protein [Chloroflexota bacterium]
MSNQTILRITNHHAATCGTPPTIAEQPGRYLGYFENEFGEQWIFVREPGATTGMLYGGDAGWATGYPVIDGQAADLVLDAPETVWLRACWDAATSPLSPGRQSGRPTPPDGELPF